MVTIKHITRGHIELEYNGRHLVIYGEALLRGHGSPDFVVYRNSLNRFSSPHQDEDIDESTKQLILNELAAALQARGMTIEIE